MFILDSLVLHMLINTIIVLFDHCNLKWLFIITYKLISMFILDFLLLHMSQLSKEAWLVCCSLWSIPLLYDLILTIYKAYISSTNNIYLFIFMIYLYKTRFTVWETPVYCIAVNVLYKYSHDNVIVVFDSYY